MGTNDASSANEAHATAVEGYPDYDEDDADDAALDEPATRGSSGRFLTDLADVLRGAGFSVKENDGWETRCNPKIGGFKHGVKGIVAHHTGASGPVANQINWIINGSDDKPLSNLVLDQTGGWWVLAAGCTNTNGRGGPWGDKIPYRRANSRCIGIEAAINGKDSWPTVMQDAYVNGVAALADHYGVDSDDVFGHEEWVRGHPRRWKWDPAGPSRFGSISSAGTWDMDKFRAEVHAARGKGTFAPSSSSSRPSSSDSTDSAIHIIEEGDSWWGIARKTMGDPANNWERLAAANGGEDRVLIVGQMVKIPGASGTSSSSSGGGGTPEFPGEAKLGMKGPIVLEWQKALIAHGVLRDTPGNRDSDFGTGLQGKIFELQQSWGWSDADGEGGTNSWNKLHAG